MKRERENESERARTYERERKKESENVTRAKTTNVLCFRVMFSKEIETYVLELQCGEGT